MSTVCMTPTMRCMSNNGVPNHIDRGAWDTRDENRCKVEQRSAEPSQSDGHQYPTPRTPYIRIQQRGARHATTPYAFECPRWSTPLPSGMVMVGRVGLLEAAGAPPVEYATAGYETGRHSVSATDRKAGQKGESGRSKGKDRKGADTY
jgi:hypothetical protein